MDVTRWAGARFVSPTQRWGEHVSQWPFQWLGLCSPWKNKGKVVKPSISSSWGGCRLQKVLKGSRLHWGQHSDHSRSGWLSWRKKEEDAGSKRIKAVSIKRITSWPWVWPWLRQRERISLSQIWVSCQWNGNCGNDCHPRGLLKELDQIDEKKF